MAETDPYMAGVFYSGQFITNEFLQTFSELGIDRRLAVLAEISPRPEVSQLVMHRNTTLSPTPANLANIYHYYHINSGGTITGGTTPTQFADKTDDYINKGAPPTHLVFYDENSVYRYVTTTGTTSPALSASGTAPSFDISTGQFVGEYLEWIGADGQTIYRMTVNSSNTISVAANRVEPERNAIIRVQHGHPFAFDGTYLWLGGLVSMGELSSEMESLEAGYGGVSLPRAGNISIQLADREFEYLADQSWDSRDIEIRVGITDTSINEYRVVLRGKTERAEADLDTLQITLRDQSILFDRSMQRNSYLGTGNYEGGTDLIGVLKPKMYGFCRHFTPILVDPALWIYQINDGPIHQVISVHTGGALLNSAGDQSQLWTWPPSQSQVDAGAYKTDLFSGYLRLASPPTSPITVVAHGSRSVPYAQSTIGRIVDVIIRERVPEASIDANSFDTYNGDQPGIAGIYISDEKQVVEAINDLVAPVGAIVNLDNLNNVTIRQIKPGVPVAFISDDSISEHATPSWRQAFRPGSSYRIGYAKCWSVLDDSDFLDNASSIGVNQFLKTEYRYQTMAISGEGITRLPNYQSAKTITFNTLLDNPTQAGEVCVRLAYLHHQMQRVYSVLVVGFAFQFKIGDTVLLQSDKMGIRGNVKSGIIVGIGDRSPTSSNEDESSLLIWA